MEGTYEASLGSIWAARSRFGVDLGRTEFDLGRTEPDLWEPGAYWFLKECCVSLLKLSEI